MDFVRSTWFRENVPLVGVLAVLLATFAGLALAGAPSAEQPHAVAQADVPPPESVEALPASGEEANTLKSQLAPDDAQAQNAAVDIVEGGPGIAPPFRFTGSAADRTRARDCLALAAMAEAGYGDADQRAVMQVILNRTRHPAFANTVCGVVYQGSQRSTGCQFTFTCDGSLDRKPSANSWARALSVARRALSGQVYAPVGLATHYHTT